MRFLNTFVAAGWVLGVGLPSAAAAASVTLYWTAPGDDSLAGRATAYDLRYSQSSITSANFANAAQAQGEPTPSAPGVRETYILSGLLTGTTYYFALKSRDDYGNWSLISNVTSQSFTATTDVAGPAPVLGFSPPRPNPARTTSTFVLSLPTPADVEVAVFDPGGRRVRTLLAGHQPAGEIHLAWDLHDTRGVRVATGFYLVRARLPNATFVRSVVVGR